MPDAFTVDFVPTVRPGENLELRKTNRDVLGYYSVAYIEQLPRVVYDFGVLTANQNLGDTEVSSIYMPDGELAAYQILPLEDLVVTISQPRAKKRFPGKNYVHVITQSLALSRPYMTRFWQWKDSKIFFNPNNPRQQQTIMNRLCFYGWRFVLDELPGKPPVFTTVPIEGM